MPDLNLNFNQNLDAFGRLRVANPQTVFDSKQISDNQPLFWDSQGTTVYNANQASSTISISGAETSRRQTYRWFNYQTGKSQLVLLTGVFGNPVANVFKRMGQFNDQNGYIFEVNSTGFAVVIRSFTSGSAVDTKVQQNDFNLDKLDGTGASGVTLDLTKTNIYFFDYQWLGVGAVRFGVVIDGKPIYCHQFNHANNLSVVYTSSPNLPLRYEVTGNGTAEITQICSTVITEGGRADTGVIRGINRGTNALTTLNNDNIYPIIGVRLKSTSLGSLVRYIDNSILCTSNAEFSWYVILKPTVVGTVPTWLNLDNSALQYSFPTNATTVTGGIVLATGLGASSNTIKNVSDGIVQSDLSLGSAINGTPDELFICVQRLTGTTVGFRAGINISETI